MSQILSFEPSIDSIMANQALPAISHSLYLLLLHPLCLSTITRLCSMMLLTLWKFEGVGAERYSLLLQPTHSQLDPTFFPGYAVLGVAQTMIGLNS